MGFTFELYSIFEIGEGKEKNMDHYNIIIKCYIFDELSYDFLLSVSDNQQRGDRIDKAF
jgi:hypothetical protein